MSDAPEFSRRYSLAEIGIDPRNVAITADAAECEALAHRFGLASIEALAAEARLFAVAEGIEAEGRLKASLVQSCVATGRPLPASIDEPFHILFAPESQEGAQEEIELHVDDRDMMAHDGQAIDLGEAVAQTLALALDPFPRASDADAVLKAAGILQEDDASPFAKLKGLFDKP